MSVRRAAFVATTLLTACSLFTDLSSLSEGEADEGGAPDVAPRIDAPVSTPLAEAGTFADAGFDAGVVPVTCPNKPVAICETFDRDETANGFTVVAENGATVGRQVIDGQSVLIATVPAAQTGNAPVAYWRKNFTTTVTKLSFDADMAFDQRTAAAPEFHILFQVFISKGPAFDLVYVNVPNAGNGFALQEFRPTPGALDYHPIQIAPNAVHHVHWDVEVGGRTHFAVDGIQTVDSLTPSWFSGGLPSLLLGVTLSEVPTTPITAMFDNVVFLGE